MVYNCKVLSYPVGNHVTIYNKSFTRGETVKKDNLTKVKNYNKQYRSNEQIQHSLDVASSRAKNKVYQIARCNKWEWFITLTFDRTKTDASDYDLIINRLNKFLHNLKNSSCPNLKYLIVAELHADNKHYHFHGLLANCEGLKFKFWKIDSKSNKPIFNILNWKWGYTTASQVENTQRVSSYITKYITKDVDRHLAEKNRYYFSRNCELPDEILCTVDEDKFLQLYNDDIEYMKSVKVSQAGLKCNYYEVSD
jgi:hypothetical protein